MATQETGSPDIQTADQSDIVIITSSAERASAHVMIYPNSGSVNPFIIIIENKSRQLPVMNSDATEAPGNSERGDRGATAMTDIAGAKLTTRTGCQYTQISRTHVESEEVEETSRECANTG